MRVVFCGISNKKDKDPLDITTKSGFLVHEIAKELKDCSIVYINLVNQCLTDEYGKPRFPTLEEKQQGASFISLTHRSDIIVCLGKMVYEQLCKYDLRLVHIYHPSYIHRFGKDKNGYIKEAKKMILKGLVAKKEGANENN